MKCKTGKKAYKTEEQAAKKAIYLNCRDNRVHKLREYKCRECGYYHLTKLTEEQCKRGGKGHRTMKANLDRESEFIVGEGQYWRDHFQRKERKKRKFDKRRSKEKPNGFIHNA